MSFLTIEQFADLILDTSHRRVSAIDFTKIRANLDTKLNELSGEVSSESSKVDLDPASNSLNTEFWETISKPNHKRNKTALIKSLS